jgi:uncharacterized membrane protein
MGIFEELQKEINNIDEETEYKGYWYKISHVLIILVMGALCEIKNPSDIHKWAISKPTQQFLQQQFGIGKIMSRAQFYNILAVVNAEKFKLCFIRWMQKVMFTVASDSETRVSAVAGKTVAIDGKTVNSTGKLTEDGSILNIVSAHVAEMKLTIGSHECMSYLEK